MTIIKAINELSDKMMMKCNFSKIRNDCEELVTVMNYFDIDKETAVVTATFIQRRIEEDSSYFNLEDLERDWTLNLTEILNLMPSVDIMLSKKICMLRNRQKYIDGTADRATQFVIDEELIDVLCYNKPFSEYEPEYDTNFKFDAPSFIADVKTLPKRTIMSKYSFSNFVYPYRDDKWVAKLLKEIGNTNKDSHMVNVTLNLKFFCYAIKYLYDDKSASVNDICQSLNLSSSDTIEVLRSFKEEKNELLKHEYLEIEKTDIADNVKVKWGDKVIKAFDGIEDLLLMDHTSKELNKVLAKDIKEKELFYNKENQSDIDRLQNILKEENYVELRKRLEEKNLPKGLTILLHGAPGTGKTETVMQLARQTGRDVFHLNIEQVKSCWVGESEKNVKSIFKAYYASKSRIKPILLFNEADAIISKRTEVDGSNSAVTKMENAIQNILLEELEKFDGIFIATTNLTQNIDEAFDRRLLFKLKFENPTVDVKEKIWKSKLDFITDWEAHKLAISYDLSGGQIDNIYRKSEVDYILYGKQPTLDDLLDFCKKEKLSDDGRTPLGFRS